MASRLKDSLGYRHPFIFGIHYLGGIGEKPRTIIELAMVQCSAALRQQPQWWKHFRVPETRKEWEGWALGRKWCVHTPTGHVEVELSAKQVRYILDELEGYAALHDEINRCQPSCFERIWESTSLLNPEVHDTFQQQAQKLYDEQRLYSCEDTGVTSVLVDPMLNCFVYDRTLVSQSGSNTDQYSTFPRTLHRSLPDVYAVSLRFQLLPSDVRISLGGKATFLSYINNLHPEEHSDVYKTLETILTGMLPMFEHTLTDLHRNNPLFQRIRGSCKYTVWEEPEPPEFSDDEEGWVNYEKEMQQWIMTRPLSLPDVPDTGYPGGLEERKYRVSLRERDIQVITSISRTSLEFGGPQFEGTPWHVEGMRNERIVASGLYILSAENITPPSIHFRMAVTYPRDFSAGDTGATLRTWGLHHHDPCNQELGAVVLRNGHALSFPNIYQHRLAPFQLADPTRPGHLTVLAFHLVDPDVRPILSTATVPPQQVWWIRRALAETAVGRRLPVELRERILEQTEGLMGEREAWEVRRELCEARENFRVGNDKYHFCIPFDVWNGPGQVSE